MLMRLCVAPKSKAQKMSLGDFLGDQSKPRQFADFHFVQRRLNFSMKVRRSVGECAVRME